MRTTLESSADLRLALAEIAGNLWYSWNADARELFARLDPEGWERVEHNPTALLAELSPEPLERAAADPQVVAEAERLRARLAADLHEPGWWAAAHGGEEGFLAAYFSAEFGVDESLPI